MIDDEIIMRAEFIRDNLKRYHENRKHENPSQSIIDSFHEYMRIYGMEVKK